jgi:multidrug efflux pump
MDDVRIAVAAANVNQAKAVSTDTFSRSRSRPTTRSSEQAKSGARHRLPHDAPLPLRSTADVIDGAENVARPRGWDTPAIIVNIQRQPGANLIEVVDRAKQLLPQLQSALPTAVQVTVLTDRTTTIRASVHDVQFELMLAVVLVVLVIFVFLRSAAATFIPGITVPVSIVGTFAVMYGLGFSEQPR